MKPEELAAALLETKQRIGKALAKGRRIGAERSVARLKQVKKPLDRGTFRAAWRVIASADGGISITNDSPMAGVIELGARPHAVSAEGQQALLEWVMRHDVKDEAEAKEIVWAIVQRLKREGQPGNYIVRDRLEAITNDTKLETERALREEMKDRK